MAALSECGGRGLHWCRLPVSPYWAKAAQGPVLGTDILAEYVLNHPLEYGRTAGRLRGRLLGRLGVLELELVSPTGTGLVA